ncbi:Plasmodium vivax Vir protein, putative [Plasmodium ovale]|uniref:Plasmodium vivax Vir protein, putative n=1 Tax=Plasmodium ovale TaxID=36330 RepID=A0A1C3KKJ6_PLAOA|nr:Plasmodium vivax Vir protein, putative [Plasmodium ovale]
MLDFRQFENNSNLLDLPAFKTYVELNTIKVDYKCDYVCKPTEYLSKYFHGFDTVCKELAKSLKYLYNDSKAKENQEKLCRYISFWVHEKFSGPDFIKVKNSYNQYMKHLTDTWNNINDLLVDPGNYACKPEFYNINMEDIKKRKILYDYCENYDTMSSKIFDHENGDCKKYYDYLKRMKKLHRDFENVWSVQDDKVPQFIKDCENHPPSASLTATSCMSIEKERGTHEEEEEEDELVPTLEDMDSLEHGNEDSSNVMFILLPFFGILFSIFFSYKYTSLGSRLRSFLLSNKIIRSTIDRKEVEKYTTPSNEHINENLYENFLNVGYTSM